MNSGRLRLLRKLATPVVASQFFAAPLSLSLLHKHRHTHTHIYNRFYSLTLSLFPTKEHCLEVLIHFYVKKISFTDRRNNPIIVKQLVEIFQVDLQKISFVYRRCYKVLSTYLSTHFFNSNLRRPQKFTSPKLKTCLTQTKTKVLLHTTKLKAIVQCTSSFLPLLEKSLCGLTKQLVDDTSQHQTEARQCSGAASYHQLAVLSKYKT